jgi:hypothetical protein
LRDCPVIGCGGEASLPVRGEPRGATSIYNHRLIRHDDTACGETYHSAGQLTVERESKYIMGDKSPKANQKKSGQKQTKNNSLAATKKAAVASKQAAGKK